MNATRRLAGRTVVVTRASEQSGPLVEALRAVGAEVVEVPTIAVADPDDGGEALRAAIAGLADYEWVVVTSVNGAERFADALLGRTLPPTVAVAAVGPGTADALRRRDVVVSLVPETFVAEGLLAAFPSPAGRARVLLAQAEAARPVLADGLRAAGWRVDSVVAYRTMPAAPPPALVHAAACADAITFTSASTVESWLAVAGPSDTPSNVVCIGPVTAAAAHRGGLTVTRVAHPHSLPGLVDAVVALWV
ncbi:MAG: uroporphyrinogen-III synthase [Acidimicrobiaceae bacterium]|jgi:uroporphyrinogen-III synthase|nr:uroporphyrinogen-III synthase [Acidimicrobiaceae bacterium]